MPFDPNQPSELVKSGGVAVAEPNGFDPSQPSEVVRGPVSAQRGPSGGPQKPPSIPTQPPDPWEPYFGGLDKIDGPQWKALDAATTNPKEARAQAINQGYWGQHGVSPNAIQANWPAARIAIAQKNFGYVGKDITDEQLYNLQSAKVQEDKDALAENKPWHWYSPLTQHPAAAASLFWHGINQPIDKLPDAPIDKLPDLPELGNLNPKLVGSVYNVVKPQIEGLTSPLSLAAVGGGGALAKAAAEGSIAAKAGITSMSGLFTAMMGSQAVAGVPEIKRVMADPNATTLDKARAWANEVGNVFGTLTGGMGMVTGLFPGTKAVIAPAEVAGKTPEQVSQILASKAPDATPAQLEGINSTLETLDKLAPPKAESDIAKGWDELKKVFAPAARGEGAEETAGSLREHGSELAQRTDRAEAALEDASKQLMKLDPSARWDVVDKIEAGTQQVDPKLQGFADTTRAILDTRREEIRALGTGKLEHFIDDYFPHIWKDPEKAAAAFQQAQAKAPIEGSKSFLKQRTIPTIREGMALGLEPVTSNPVEMVLLKAREMDKYILGQKWLAEMKDKEFVKFVRSGTKPPEGYEPINDNIATVYGNPSHPGAMQIEGKYYAPSQVATVANNYLSPGLNRFASFRAYMSLANGVNRFQLGLSAFHLGFTSIDTSISKLALALEHAQANEPLKAAGKIAQIPFAPFSTLVQGNRVLKEWLRPGTQGDEIAKIVDGLRAGGARAKMDQFYQTNVTKKMMELFREGGAKGYIGGLWRAPLAAIEQVSKPLMEYIVPRQKLGVAADMAKVALDKLPAAASHEEVRAVMGKVWDSVDNRMGQMVYDNLFWHKTAKDLAMASVRSVGWDLGTIREIGGGLVDTGKFLKDALTPKQKAEFTHRMAYTISLPILTGVVGATYQYLRTGKGPEELRDYFFPKTGEKDPQGRDVRMNIPTYMKDVYHYGHDFIGTVGSKVSPFPALVIEALHNTDYFDRPIRNSDDPLVKQLSDEAKFFGENFAPIGIRQFEQSKASNQSKFEQAENFVGVTRAPAWVGETAAEQLAGKLAGDKFKSATSEDSKNAQDRMNLMAQLRNGTPEQKSDAEAKLKEMVASGELTNRQVQNLRKGTEHTYLENMFSHLSVHPATGDINSSEAIRVFKLATPAERAVLNEPLRLKIMRSELTDAEKREAQAERRKLWPDRNPDTTLRP